MHNMVFGGDLKVEGYGCVGEGGVQDGHVGRSDDGGHTSAQLNTVEEAQTLIEPPEFGCLVAL